MKSFALDRLEKQSRPLPSGKNSTESAAVAVQRNSAGWKNWVRNWVPPPAIRLAASALDHVRLAPWEYMPDGWNTNERIRGWNVASIAELQKKNWQAYAESLQGTGPLGVNHEDLSKPYSGNLREHNTLISYAYVLALAACQKQRLSLLDWGGGIGHYFLLSKALLPDIEIDYHCHDVPLLCQAGREVLPQCHFYETPQETFSRRYDLVLASSSIWYEENWRPLLDQLTAIASPYLFVTRMIFIERDTSYVAIQRPSAMGYRTEYLCWILNRQEFLDHVRSRGMELAREFLICAAQHIHRAPEQGDYRGFLFRKRNPAQE
jgi:putative methyltransferase (TIGR04325 family)